MFVLSLPLSINLSCIIKDTAHHNGIIFLDALRNKKKRYSHKCATQARAQASRPASQQAHNTAAAGAWCLAHYYSCTVRISMRVASMRIYYLHTCMLICLYAICLYV